MQFLRLLSLAAVAGVVTASSASAQVSADNRAGVPRRNLISANPLGILFEWYNGEYERALGNTLSLAGAASSFGFDDERYTAVEGIARFYPAARALRGFSVGMSLGVVDISDDNDNCEFCEDDSGTAATIGIRGDYVWILGRDQNFAVAAGIGAKRLLGNDIGTEGLPIGRLSIGYAW